MPLANQAKLQWHLHHAVMQVDQQMSPWIKGLFVNAFNATRVGEWILMPVQAAAVIKKAIEVEPKSNGAFSIAVAPQVRHPGFGISSRNFGTLPKMGASAGDSIELKDSCIRKTQEPACRYVTHPALLSWRTLRAVMRTRGPLP